MNGHIVRIMNEQTTEVSRIKVLLKLFIMFLYQLPIIKLLLKHLMPFVEVDSLNEKEVVDGYHGRAIHTGTMTFMYWTVTEGAVMPQHSHLHQQVAHVLQGKFELTVNGETRLLEPGVVAIIPPHVQHGGKAITACKLLDVFNPEREDYKF